MAENYKHLYHQMKMMVEAYQDEIVPGLRKTIEEMEKNRGEVVRGRWEDNHCTVCGMMPLGDELWELCDFAPPRFEMFMDYCPSCGAKMDGDRNG